jgi:hypothetical protein
VPDADPYKGMSDRERLIAMRKAKKAGQSAPVAVAKPAAAAAVTTSVAAATTYACVNHCVLY